MTSDMQRQKDLYPVINQGTDLTKEKNVYSDHNQHSRKDVWERLANEAESKREIVSLNNWNKAVKELYDILEKGDKLQDFHKSRQEKRENLHLELIEITDQWCQLDKKLQRISVQLPKDANLKKSDCSQIQKHLTEYFCDLTVFVECYEKFKKDFSISSNPLVSSSVEGFDYGVQRGCRIKDEYDQGEEISQSSIEKIANWSKENIQSLEEIS